MGPVVMMGMIFGRSKQRPSQDLIATCTDARLSQNNYVVTGLRGIGAVMGLGRMTSGYVLAHRAG